MSKIIVIGSGLSAIASIKVLVEKGYKPLVLDFGEKLDDDKQLLKNKISTKEKFEWETEDIEKIIQNSTLNNKFPRKLYMGSDFFYFNKNKHLEFLMKNSTSIYSPAASLAKNGLSTSWGSAVLPMAECDQQVFPYESVDIKKYFKKALERIDYVATNDDMIRKFDLIKDPNHTHKNRTDIEEILNKLCKNKSFNKKFISGHSRLLTNFSKTNGCINCGHCMSGCFNDHIYKPEKDLQKLIDNKKIDYISGVFVDSFKEFKDRIEVNYIDSINNLNKVTCNKLIVAAGALNTTVLYAKSYNLYENKFKLLSKNGSIVPMLSFNLLKDDWPNRHTLPLIFFTLFDNNKTNMYTQISKPNELIIKKLKGKWNKHSILSKFFSNNFLVAHSNLCSDNSDHYSFKVNDKNSVKKNIVEITRVENHKRIASQKLLYDRFKKIFNSINIYPLNILRKETDSQHNGGSLPMVKNITSLNQVNENGNSNFSKNIYYVDSSVMPKLPSTPIGLPIMANAMRIVDKINSF